MTIEEFKIEYAKCRRLTGIRMACSVAAIFLALGGAAMVRSIFGDAADLAAPLIIFGVGVPIMLTGFYYTDLSYRKFPNLVCPHCDGNLYRAKSIIVSTGNCSSCDRRVLCDDLIGS